MHKSLLSVEATFPKQHDVEGHSFGGGGGGGSFVEGLWHTTIYLDAPRLCLRESSEFLHLLRS